MKSKSKSLDNKSTATVVEGPEMAYAHSDVSNKWTTYKGGALKNVTGNYVKRSINLIGLSNQKPFSPAENEADFIICIREGFPKKALDTLLDFTGITIPEITEIMHTSDRTLRRYTSKQA